MKKFSIITINYNNCAGLRKTIESVVNQTCKDFEYIIIDGGSTDGSVEVIQEYADRIDYWVSEPDKGIYNAMNKGILKANGEYLNFMNSGDCFYGKDTLCGISSKLGADIIWGRVCFIGTKDNNYEELSLSIPRVSMYALYTNTLPHQGTFIRTSLFQNHLYDESLKIVSDWKFFLEAVILKGCSTYPSNMVIARCENRGVSSDAHLLIEEKNRVLNELIPVGVLTDYSQVSKMGMNMLENMIYLNSRDRLRKYVYYIVTLLIRIHSFFTKSK